MNKIAFAVIILVAVFLIPIFGVELKNDRLNRFWNRITAAGGLKRGMTQPEVMQVTGAPDNQDRDIVWLWVAAHPERIKKWTDYYEKKFPNGSALYLYFKDGKLVNEFPANPAKDSVLDNLYEKYKKVNAANNGRVPITTKR